MKFRLIEEKENKKYLDLDEALGLNKSNRVFSAEDSIARFNDNGDTHEIVKAENGKYFNNYSLQPTNHYNVFAPSSTAGPFDTEEDARKYMKKHRPQAKLIEDTIKQNGKWVNKGKEGTHGTFKTKEEADAQRKAMFANSGKNRDFGEALYGKNEVADFFDKAKRLGVETLGQLRDLLNQEESKGNTEKEKIDAYADSVELGNDTLSNESLKEYYDPTEVITDYFDESEQKNYGIDKDGYTKDGLERYVHCGWCEEPTPLSEMRKELNLGYICKDCQDTLYSHGEKAVYEEALDEKLIQGKSDATLKKNIATEVKAGKNPKQAYAVAKSIQKKNESFEDEHLGEVIKDDEIVDYFDNSVHDEDIVEDDFDEEHIEELTKKAIEESKKHTKEVGTTITENKSIGTPTQEIINESINPEEDVVMDYVSPNAVDPNMKPVEVDLNNI